MTLTQLKKLGQKWQERLRLVDWDIVYRFATKEEATECWGFVEKDYHAKTAVIALFNPKSPEWVSGDHHKDPEAILVHELLHVHFALLNHNADSAQASIEENIVNQVGRLLVALDRQDESVMNAGRRLSKNARIGTTPVKPKKDKEKKNAEVCNQQQ